MKDENGSFTALLVGLAVMGAGVMLAGCTEEDTGLLGVVVSIAPQLEAVERIGGGLVGITVMVPEGQSPHTYEPVPGQLIDVARAKVYFKVGSGVEFELRNIAKLMEQNRDMEVIDCSEGVRIKTMDEHLGDGEDHNPEGTGDDHDHSASDPHIWLSPNNYRIMAGNVLDGLIAVDPDNEDTYRYNHESYISELDAMIEEIGTGLEPHRGREFLVYHPSWGYFGDDLGLVQLAIEDEGKQPGPQGLAAVIEQSKERGIKVVFVSPQFDSSSAEEIAREIGGEVVTVDPLAGEYISNMKEVAGRMREGFEK